jgi:signal transduction histidine kinase
MATSYLNGANIWQGLLQYNEAYSMYQQAIKLGSEIGFDEAVYESYAGLSRYYETQGDLPKALFYFKAYKDLADSVYNATVSQQIATLEKNFATQKKEKQIQEQQFDIQRKNYLLYGSLALLLLGLLLGINYFRRLRLKKEKLLQEAIMQEKELSTKAVMEAEENERRRIAEELHDGVGQMMSAVKMNLSALEADWSVLAPERRMKMEKIASLVDESCKEVRSVSHSMMPNALLKRGLAAAVRDFIEKIDSSVLQVQLYAEGLNQHLEPTVETMLYRIIQEAVNNVIKHSAANRLFINLVQDDEGLSISIEDNGKGFDTTHSMQAEGIGLKNIRSRVHFLKGTVDFSSQPGNGTMIAIFVPVPFS